MLIILYKSGNEMFQNIYKNDITKNINKKESISDKNIFYNGCFHKDEDKSQFVLNIQNGAALAQYIQH
jgi:hypothetical protein